MCDSEELIVDGRAANDSLHNSGEKRRVAYIASLEYIEKCDCLPKVKGRVVYAEYSWTWTWLANIMYRNWWYNSRITRSRTRTMVFPDTRPDNIVLPLTVFPVFFCVCSMASAHLCWRPALEEFMEILFTDRIRIRLKIQFNYMMLVAYDMKLMPDIRFWAGLDSPLFLTMTVMSSHNPVPCHYLCSPTSSNSFIGYLLTVGYILNWLLLLLKLCVQVARNTSPIYCTSINPLGLCALPTLLKLLTLPCHNLSFRSRAFCISAPKNWNTLPLVYQSHTLSTFRNRLKTFCFRSA